ncbi:MAG: hypothetical protein KatS3mg065_1043 [Chloroflexota bacterium]|nr:MAG: hypothetical protein KatS3mg065_1043 [Chloroflexota bacterium]
MTGPWNPQGERPGRRATGSSRQSGPSLRRLTAVALVVTAVLPALGVGSLTYVRLGTALHEDARLRAEQAAVTARAVLARSAADLDRLTTSYAGWPQLAAAVAADELDVIRADVLEFLVDQGQLSGAVLVAGERSIAAGRPSLTADLIALATTALQGTTARPMVDGVYLVAIAAVTDQGEAAPAGQVVAAPARLGFARRLDAEFAVELRGLTGFDVAILDSSGRASVATNPDVLDTLAPLDGLPDSGEHAGFLVVRVRLPDGNETGTAESPTTGEEPTPPAAGELLLSASLSAAQAATGQLPAIVAALAGTMALGAFVLALWLSRVLARRLAAVHASLLAIAEGRRPVPIPTHDEDPIDRLVEALGRLLTALERRETTIRRSFEAVAETSVDRPPDAVATALLDAIDDIFGLRWSVIVEADGTVFARSARAPADVATAPLGDVREMPSASAGFVVADLDPRPPPIPFDPLVLDGERRMVDSRAGARRLVAHLSPTVKERGTGSGSAHEDPSGPPRPGASIAWSPADEASLRLVALLIGSAIEDAERYATAAERALRLERLNQLQRQFLRSISHNLRTPLTTIGLAVDDLAEAAPVAADPELARRAQAIRTEAARLARLVDQVLTLSRLEAGTVDLAAEPLVPAEVAAAVWQELDVERPFRIDDGTDGRPVLADRRALEQILWILLDNAVRYAPTGPIEVRIELRGAEAAPPGVAAPPGQSPPSEPTAQLEIAVLDEGPGVPPGERGRIFHRFVRGSTAGHQTGTGLGLSLARSLARLMGGDLVYVDRGGAAGACFALRIPAESEAAPGREGGVRRSADRTRPRGQARAARVRAGH